MIVSGLYETEITSDYALGESVSSILLNKSSIFFYNLKKASRSGINSAIYF